MLSLILSPSNLAVVGKRLSEQLMIEVQKRFKACSTEILIIATPNSLDERVLDYLLRATVGMEIALILAGTPELLPSLDSPTINSIRVFRSRGHWDCYWLD
jgi:hypothetical protein